MRVIRVMMMITAAFGGLALVGAFAVKDKAVPILLLVLCAVILLVGTLAGALRHRLE